MTVGKITRIFITDACHSQQIKWGASPIKRETPLNNGLGYVLELKTCRKLNNSGGISQLRHPTEGCAANTIELSISSELGMV